MLSATDLIIVCLSVLDASAALARTQDKSDLFGVWRLTRIVSNGNDGRTIPEPRALLRFGLNGGGDGFLFPIGDGWFDLDRRQGAKVLLLYHPTIRRISCTEYYYTLARNVLMIRPANDDAILVFKRTGEAPASCGVPVLPRK
jgi:hypothetical protein